MKPRCAVLNCALLLMLAGCSLAQPAETEPPPDRLVGVLVSRESLAAAAGDEALSEGRLYALEEDGKDGREPKVSFPTGGVALYCASYRYGDGPFDYLYTSGEKTGVSESELIGGDDCFALSGRIYVLPMEGEISCFFNPIYQDAEERLYAVQGPQSVGQAQGQGFCIQWESRQMFQSLQEFVESEEGSNYIHAEIWAAYPAERVSLLQMDGENQVIRKTEYAPEEMPPTLTPEADTAYIVTEIYGRDLEGNTTITRTLYEPYHEYLLCPILRDDGFLVDQKTQLDWK